MARKNTIKYSKISNGQYTVTIDVQKFQDKIGLQDFESKLSAYLAACARDIEGICEFDGNKLIYKSETLFPAQKYIRKQKVLVVFGNPALYSIKYGMFFFSKTNKSRHSMWGKLERANLIKPVRFNDSDLFRARKKEAGERKKLIYKGEASDEYCLGMTTFYSFPTPVRGKFRDVQGVEKLFGPNLTNTIIPCEVDRILRYSFARDAILVFVQKSSYEAFIRQSDQSAIFWPVRGKNSSGAYLSQIVKREVENREGGIKCKSQS